MFITFVLRVDNYFLRIPHVHVRNRPSYICSEFGRTYDLPFQLPIPLHTHKTDFPFETSVHKQSSGGRNG
jgi:hypothetical protein